MVTRNEHGELGTRSCVPIRMSPRMPRERGGRSHPKRPMSSFLSYYVDNLPELRAAGVKRVTKAAKILGKRWKQLEFEAKPYIEKSKTEWERYKREKSLLSSLPTSENVLNQNYSFNPDEETRAGARMKNIAESKTLVTPERPGCSNYQENKEVVTTKEIETDVETIGRKRCADDVENCETESKKRKIEEEEPAREFTEREESSYNVQKFINGPHS
ncbi:transcription factor A, mitochondrial-like [Centruroides vittatus]|uniref:transcription factor A, mitochondrial-like n=1 Tax=Centruroides vittatus TaxID=120091 RepID=UPI00350F802E